MNIKNSEKVLGKSKGISREGDLKPKGVKYTIRGDYGFNETFEHIFRERLKS